MYPLMPLQVVVARKRRRALVTLMRLLGIPLLRLEHHAVEMRAIRRCRRRARRAVVRHQRHGPAGIPQPVHVLRRLLLWLVMLLLSLLVMARVVGQSSTTTTTVMAATAVAGWVMVVAVRAAGAAAEERRDRCGEVVGALVVCVGHIVGRVAHVAEH